MKILSPKTSFLGGALVSASHLGKLFPDKLVLFGDKSEFLDVNEVPYTLVQDYEIDSKSIWCNDICTDKGYYPDVIEDNIKLWNYLTNFENVILVNHQPISRCYIYLHSMLSYLSLRGVHQITLLNYRACWNEEFDNYLKIHFPRVLVGTLPYHYYLDDIDLYSESQLSTEDIKICAIGRTNSRCKIQSALPELEKIFGPIESIVPDPKVSNVKFLEELSKRDIILTGYYYGGEGNPEVNKPFNKLEWSYLDSILAGCMPVTSTLFLSELERLTLDTPTVDYYLTHFEILHKEVGQSYVQFVNNQRYYKKVVWNELANGNELTKLLIKKYE